MFFPLLFYTHLHRDSPLSLSAISCYLPPISLYLLPRWFLHRTFYPGVNACFPVPACLLLLYAVYLPLDIFPRTATRLPHLSVTCPHFLTVLHAALPTFYYLPRTTHATLLPFCGSLLLGNTLPTACPLDARTACVATTFAPDHRCHCACLMRFPHGHPGSGRPTRTTPTTHTLYLVYCAACRTRLGKTAAPLCLFARLPAVLLPTAHGSLPRRAFLA